MGAFDLPTGMTYVLRRWGDMHITMDEFVKYAKSHMIYRELGSDETDGDDWLLWENVSFSDYPTRDELVAMMRRWDALGVAHIRNGKTVAKIYKEDC